MSKLIIKGFIILVIRLTVPQIVDAQGFANLDFEQANLSSYGEGSVPASDAIPGWTAYLGGVVMTNVYYDTGFAEIGVNVQGATNGFLPIQGNYSITLIGSRSNPASIGQTGTIPMTAQSLIFYGSFLYQSDTVSFNGQALSVVPLSYSYNIFGVDISSLAGQTGQLLFTDTALPFATGDIIDNIQFSSTPVPEPSPSWLLLIGSGIFFYVRRILQH